MKVLQLTKMKVSFKNIAKYYILQKVLYTFQSKYFILKKLYILILLNRRFYFFKIKYYDETESLTSF